MTYICPICTTIPCKCPVARASVPISSFSTPVVSPSVAGGTTTQQPEDEPLKQRTEGDALGKLGVLLLEFGIADHAFNNPQDEDEIEALHERWQAALQPLREAAERMRVRAVQQLANDIEAAVEGVAITYRAVCSGCGGPILEGHFSCAGEEPLREYHMGCAMRQALTRWVDVDAEECPPGLGETPE